MSNSDNRSAPKITYTISNEQMLKFISNIPTLAENNKSCEYLVSAQLKSDENTSAIQNSAVQIKFSYDFVMDRWFLNDKRIAVLDLERD